jgi:hypothetical protein
MATATSAAEITRQLEASLNSGKANEALAAIKQLKEIGVILTFDFIQKSEERKQAGPSVEVALRSSVEAPRASYVEAPRASYVEAPRASYVEAPRASYVEAPSNVEAPRGSYEVARSSLELIRDPYRDFGMSPSMSARSSYASDSSRPFPHESIRSLKNLLISRGLDPTTAFKKSKNVGSWEEYDAVLMQHP